MVVKVALFPEDLFSFFMLYCCTVAVKVALKLRHISAPCLMVVYGDHGIGDSLRLAMVSAR